MKKGEIKEKALSIDIVQFIGEHVVLKRTGVNHKGLCPFHEEKTPSFTVYASSFHCFGCGVHGDIIEFVKQYYQLDFVEALEKLTGEKIKKETPILRKSAFKNYQILEELQLMEPIITEVVVKETITRGLDPIEFIKEYSTKELVGTIYSGAIQSIKRMQGAIEGKLYYVRN